MRETVHHFNCISLISIFWSVPGLRFLFANLGVAILDSSCHYTCEIHKRRRRRPKALRNTTFDTIGRGIEVSQQEQQEASNKTPPV